MRGLMNTPPPPPPPPPQHRGPCAGYGLADERLYLSLPPPILSIVWRHLQPLLVSVMVASLDQLICGLGKNLMKHSLTEAETADRKPFCPLLFSLYIHSFDNTFARPHITSTCHGLFLVTWLAGSVPYPPVHAGCSVECRLSLCLCRGFGPGGVTLWARRGREMAKKQLGVGGSNARWTELYISPTGSVIVRARSDQLTLVALTHRCTLTSALH
ncbi:hypothetical protein JZ751_021968 [Albula glossodonta]|uniref:Uncharacterized protein n=1 Tax=Albula glossodonta TaxID=121402 RepID=A0A8T2NLY9_9TELE|nr:hypothetical protein JZ751_021968 [Albula glossodonta]